MRETAQEFLGRLVAHVLDRQPLDCLSPTAPDRPYWFFGHYEHDATVRQLLANYRGIDQWLAETFPTEGTPAEADIESAAGYYDYLHGAVRFWYFDTNHSAQGEELYLSLNASAEPLTGSENLKAYLLADLPAGEKNAWGHTFEEWEQLFWEHRDHKTQPQRDASPGLDEFFRWVAVCETVRRLPTGAKTPAAAVNLLRSGSAQQVREALSATKRPADPAEAARARLKEVGRYVAALRFLYDAWRPQALAQAVACWHMEPAAAARPLPELAWLHPLPTEPLKPLDCLRLLPVLAYLRGRGETERNAATHGVGVYRVVRYFYNLSRVENVTKTPFEMAVSAIRLGHQLGAASADVADLAGLPAITPTVDVELAKLFLFKELTGKPKERGQAEALCWKLEDDAYNLGEIAHLFADLNDLGLSKLQNVAKKYEVLFGGLTDRRQLQTLLLAFGPYQEQSSNNNYYVNYYFANWRNTVTNPIFKSLLAEMTVGDDAIALLYEKRKQKFLRAVTPEKMAGLPSLHQQLFMLAALFDTALKPKDSEKGCAIWGAGNYAGWKYYDESPPKPLFADKRNLLNAGGSFGYRSSYTTELFAKLRESQTKARLSFKALIAQTFGGRVIGLKRRAEAVCYKSRALNDCRNWSKLWATKASPPAAFNSSRNCFCSRRSWSRPALTSTPMKTPSRLRKPIMSGMPRRPWGLKR